MDDPPPFILLFLDDGIYRRIDLARIFNLGKETETIEFKKSTGEIKDGVISIASILNKHGSGDLYFGVRNNGDVIGQEITDSTLRSISQAIRGGIKPPFLSSFKSSSPEIIIYQ